MEHNDIGLLLDRFMALPTQATPKGRDTMTHNLQLQIEKLEREKAELLEALRDLVSACSMPRGPGQGLTESQAITDALTAIANAERN